MRQLRKNQRTMYYALYDKDIPIGDGLETKAGYKMPVMFKASLSSGKSDSEENPFGTSVDYDRIICSVDMSLPITETALLWIGIEPNYNEDGSVDSSSANYKVSAHPIDGLKNLRIAVKLIKKSVVVAEDTTENTDTSGSTESGSSGSSSEDDW